jgi:hypothetical protein
MWIGFMARAYHIKKAPAAGGGAAGAHFLAEIWEEE